MKRYNHPVAANPHPHDRGAVHARFDLYKVIPLIVLLAWWALDSALARLSF
jgi:hypothetical protein